MPVWGVTATPLSFLLEPSVKEEDRNDFVETGRQTVNQMKDKKEEEEVEEKVEEEGEEKKEEDRMSRGDFGSKHSSFDFPPRSLVYSSPQKNQNFDHIFRQIKSKLAASQERRRNDIGK